MKNLRAWVLALFITIVGLALASCRAGISVELRASEIFSSENLIVPVAIAIEIPSCNSEQIDEHISSILGAFADISEAQFIRCKEQGFDSFLEFALKGEIATQSGSHDVVLFRSPDENGAIYVYGKLSSDFLQRLNALADSNFQILKADDIKLEVNIFNDLNETIGIIGNGWFNGTARQHHGMHLESRQKLSLEQSNLVSAMLLNDDQSELLVAKRINPEAASG